MDSMRKLTSSSEIIEAFGGPTAMARWAKVVPSAISNWAERGIPPSWHLRLIIECRRRGFAIDPVAFDLEGEDATIFRQAVKLNGKPEPNRAA